MGYHRRSRCLAFASHDRYFSSILVFIPLVVGVPFYRNSIASDDRWSVGAQSGCGIDYGRGRETYCCLRGIFSCCAGFVAMDVYPGTTCAFHLSAAAAEALSVHPSLIVELGVRGGESTFAFERAARLSGAHVLSVDLEDCQVQSSYPKWTFVKQNDITFASQFPEWCSSHQLSPEIDVLFIDTSHLYQHTVEELRFWMPYLAANSKMIRHDTNMKRVYRRADRSLGLGWDN